MTRDTRPFWAEVLGVLSAALFCLCTNPAQAQVALDAGFPVVATPCGTTTFSTGSYTTGGATRTLVLAVMANTSSGLDAVFSGAPSGGPASWTALATTASPGGVGVWYAQTSSTLTGATTTVTLGGTSCGSVVLWSFSGAGTPGTALTAEDTTPSLGVVASSTGGRVYYCAAYWNSGVTPTFLGSVSSVHHNNTAQGDAVWCAQHASTTTAASTYTLGHSMPGGAIQSAVAWEVQAGGGGGDPEPPDEPPATTTSNRMMGHW